MDEPKSFFSNLFDMSFSSFITTKIIKFLFVVAVVASGLWALAVLIIGFSSGSVGQAIGFLILAPIVFVLGVIMSRVYLELLIVMFRIAENTGRLVEHAEGRPGGTA